MATINGRFMSVDDAAKHLDVTTGRIRQLLRKKKDGLEGIKINERAWAVDRESAAKYKAANHKPGPKPKRRRAG